MIDDATPARARERSVDYAHVVWASLLRPDLLTRLRWETLIHLSGSSSTDQASSDRNHVFARTLRRVGDFHARWAVPGTWSMALRCIAAAWCISVREIPMIVGGACEWISPARTTSDARGINGEITLRQASEGQGSDRY